MAQSKVRVGVIGANVNTGWGRQAHIPALKGLPEFELTAVCTAHKETAEESAQRFGARFAFHNHIEMANHPEIDLVAVVVRVPTHYRLTMDVLNAGKPVYTEWPLGVNLKEAQEMADLARAKGLLTMAGMQGRCSPAFLWLKELIQEGYVGEVLSCHLVQFASGVMESASDRSWRRDRTLGVNTMTVAFGHAIDSFCMCVGEFAEISGVVSTQVPQWHEVDTNRMVDVTSPDHILVTGRLVNGAVATARVASVPYQGSGLRMEVYGREGTLVLEAGQQQSQQSASVIRGGKAGATSLQEVPIPERLTWVPDSVPQGPPFNVAQMYRRFEGALRSGQRAEPDFDTAVRLHKLLDAIQRASDEGKAQTLS